MKKILLILVLLTATLFAEINDPRLLRYPEARQWSKDADTNGESAYNIGVLYREVIKDNEKAIEWYKKAYKMNNEDASINSTINIAAIFIDLKKYEEAEKWYKKGIAKGSPEANFGLGLLYKKLHRYRDAIFYYKKAYKLGSVDAATSLGYLFSKKLKEKNKAIEWYKKGVKNGDKDAIENLSYVYHDKKDNITATAYVLASIEYGYGKKETFDYLKNDWKIDQATIKKAYQLQKTLDIPKHYYDPELEETPPKKKTGRR